jgi:hypothetical protein
MATVAERRCRQTTNIPNSRIRNGPAHKRNGFCIQARFEQHEITIPGDQKIDHLLVTVALDQAFTDKDTQVLGKRRIAVIDGLVLADKAPHLRRQLAGPLLQSRSSSTSSGCTASAGSVNDVNNSKMASNLENIALTYSAG